MRGKNHDHIRPILHRRNTWGYIMRIVTDGKLFAIEKGWIFKRYMSLSCPQYWWSLEESYFWCWGTKDRVESLYTFVKRKNNLKRVN